MPTIKCTVSRSNWYEMYIEYSISTNDSTKKSTITHALKLKQLTNTYDFYGNMNVSYWVNGTEYAYNENVDIDDKGNAGHTIIITSGTTDVSHNATTGDASFTISCDGTCDSGGWGPGNISLSERTIRCPRIALYSLSISAGDGVSVTAKRTSSGGSGATGNLSSGSKLYYGDMLKISFTPDTNYSIATHKVNSKTFTSGNTLTVSGDVSVEATASKKVSSIGATDANIGSTSTITINKSNQAYSHTITYQLGTATGVIVTKSTAASIPWTVPTSFYSQLGNANSGICTLTCETFNGNTSLGTSTCELTVSVPSQGNNPDVVATVVDINETTKILTGDESVLIRYKSTALCTLQATPKNSATISSMLIAGVPVTGVTSGGVTTGTLELSQVQNTSFKFVATDSRGNKTDETRYPVIVDYVKLTCNPVLSRLSTTSNIITMTVSGNMYSSSLGACTNMLTLSYKYRELGGDWSNQISISISDLVFNRVTSTYYTDTPITIGDDFDYRKEYEFEIIASDGGTVDGTRYTLSKVTKKVTLQKGIPVFDWGQDDFNFNVPVHITMELESETPIKANIIDIMYPIGSVYMHSSDTLPTIMTKVGTWDSVPTGISGVYAWKRTA